MSGSSSSSTITVRVIRSLEHRNWKPLVIRNIDLDTMTVLELKQVIEEKLRDPGSRFPPPFTRDLAYYDTLKLETDPKTNKSKSADAIINTATDSIRLSSASSSQTLVSLGLSHECEISYFNSSDYENYLTRLH